MKTNNSIRTYFGITSSWIAATAFETVKDWRTVYILNEYSDKFGRNGTFALTWKPVLGMLGLGMFSLAVFLWRRRHTRKITRPSMTFFCGFIALALWYVFERFTALLFSHFDPRGDFTLLQIILMISIFPVSIAAGLMLTTAKLKPDEN